MYLPAFVSGIVKRRDILVDSHLGSHRILIWPDIQPNFSLDVRYPAEYALKINFYLNLELLITRSNREQYPQVNQYFTTFKS